MAKRTSGRKTKQPVRRTKKVARTTAAKSAKRPRGARGLLTKAVSRLKKGLPKLKTLHIMPVGGADVLRAKKTRTRR